MQKNRQSKWYYSLVHVIVLMALVLGSANMGLTSASAAPLPSAAGQAAENLPQIAQGEVLNRTLEVDEGFTFGLDVLDPAEDEPYLWDVVDEALNGQLVLTPDGASALITYTPDAGYTGTDGFTVEVADAEGSRDAITFFLTIEEKPLPPDPREDFVMEEVEPEPEAAPAQPALETAPEVVRPPEEEPVDDGTRRYVPQEPTEDETATFINQLRKDAEYSYIENRKALSNIETDGFSLDSKTTTDEVGILSTGDETPWIEVQLSQPDKIRFNNWIVGSNVNITIDDPSTVQSPDYQNTKYINYEIVDFIQYSFDIKPGQTVTITDSVNVITRELVVADLAVTGYNLSANTISGIASPGDLEFHACNDSSTCVDVSTIAASDGVWSVTPTSPFTLQEGTYGYLRQEDGDGDETTFVWSLPKPLITAYLTYNYIRGSDWPENELITLSIDDPDYGSSVDFSANDVTGGDGYVYIRLPNFKLEGGQIVTMVCGQFTKTMTIHDLSVLTYNEENDNLTGTASNGMLHLYATDGLTGESADIEVTDGTWSHDFTDVAVSPGMSAELTQYDSSGHRSEMEFYIPDPYIEVELPYSEIDGEDWPEDTLITLSIDDPDYGGAVDYSDTQLSSSGNGYVDFSIDEFTLEPGQVVTMSGGGFTRTHTILDLQVTSYTSNTITGTADPSIDTLFIEAYNDNDGEEISITVNADGSWTDVFTYLELIPGTSVWLSQYDTEGNLTKNFWLIPDPTVGVNLSSDYINGYEWPLDTEITLTIGEFSMYEDSDSLGNVWFWMDSFDLQGGQTLHMSGGGYEIDYTIADLSVTEIDQENDILSGTADPGAEVWIDASNDVDYDGLYVTADGSNGSWTAYFEGLVDIDEHSYGYVEQEDEYGNNTEVDWHVANPRFTASINNEAIWGYDWLPNTTIHFWLNDNLLTESVVSDEDGDFSLYEIDDIQSGQTIKVSDGVTEKTVFVGNLSITGYDEGTDTVWGTASPGVVEIQADDDENWDSYLYTVGSDGLWNVSFANQVDIKPGTWIGVIQDEDDGDRVEFTWSVPKPRLRVVLTSNYVNAPSSLRGMSLK